MTELENAFSELETRDITKVAALDLGSNSFHLVVARIYADNVQILHRVKKKVRLADGLNKQNELSREAIDRGLEALALCKKSMQGFEPDAVRIVATNTLRKAKNAKEFINAAKEILPYPIEVISGVEEARLIYQGVAHTASSPGKKLVIDIGGGSTEFIIGEGFEPKLMRSLQIGCVSFNKRYFKNDDLKKKSFEKAITAAEQELELITNKYRRLKWEFCVGSSGTIRILAELQAEISGNENNKQITLELLEDLIKQCCEAGSIEKLKYAAITEERKPVFAAGLAILTAIFRNFRIDAMDYSSAALREGVLYEMEGRLEHHDIRQRTAESMATRYDVDIEQATRVLNTTSHMYGQCAESWGIDDSELESILAWAALLHELGLQINSRGIQRHSAYILKNAELPGFNEEQQLLLAAVVNCHRKKIRVEEIPMFFQFTHDEVIKLISLLRIGVLLNIRRQDGIVPEFKVTCQNLEIFLSFPDGWLEESPLLCADLQTEQQRIQTLGIKLHID